MHGIAAAILLSVTGSRGSPANAPRMIVRGPSPRHGSAIVLSADIEPEAHDFEDSLGRPHGSDEMLREFFGIPTLSAAHPMPPSANALGIH